MAPAKPEVFERHQRQVAFLLRLEGARDQEGFIPHSAVAEVWHAMTRPRETCSPSLLLVLPHCSFKQMQIAEERVNVASFVHLKWCHTAGDSLSSFNLISTPRWAHLGVDIRCINKSEHRPVKIARAISSSITVILVSGECLLRSSKTYIQLCYCNGGERASDEGSLHQHEQYRMSINPPFPP